MTPKQERTYNAIKEVFLNQKLPFGEKSEAALKDLVEEVVSKK